MTHLPVRWRLTLAFACVMAIVLAATGLFVREQLGAHLDRALDASLRARGADVAALAQQSDSGLAEAKHAGVLGRRAQLAQLIDVRGRVIDASPGVPRQPLVDAAALARARKGSVGIRRTEIVGDEAVRLLAVPISAQDQRLVAVVGQSLEERDQAIAGLTNVLLLGGPIALVLASLAGFALAGAALRPVEVMRRRERAFIADASHELRSPLAMLRTELELMARDRPSGAELQTATASAIEETERLGRLADDLLLLTRADSRRFALDLAPVPAGELVAAAAARAQRRAAARQVRIGVAGEADTPLVAVDRDRIAQAIDNLLDNALRHAASEVELSTRVAGSSVEIHVLDDGPGFPPEFLPQAWERFSRADAARTDDGAGLGLSIVRTIAEVHGGRTEASNR
ncbi:MAG: integral rane sensor signal transduction histidine kinase, partial [Solirubrobacterales bacterium]|nr:integral rane sensor signal transduction histidine kinase [Solirubrobacterales bacterium]